MLGRACPHTKSNPADCPLAEVRKMKPAAISKWLDGLRTEDKEYLMLYHQCCLVIRWETERAKQRKKPRKTTGRKRP